MGPKVRPLGGERSPIATMGGGFCMVGKKARWKDGKCLRSWQADSSAE